MTMALEIGLGTFFNPPAPLASKSKVIISAIKSIEPYGKEIETKMVCVQHRGTYGHKKQQQADSILDYDMRF